MIALGKKVKVIAKQHMRIMTLQKLIAGSPATHVQVNANVIVSFLFLKVKN